MHNSFPFGSVISWRINPKDLTFPENIFDYAQNFFTKMPETHTSILMHKMEDWPYDMWYEFEASITVRINTYTQNLNSSIFDIKAPEDVKIKVIDKLRKEHYGKIYALPQTFYFIVRWAAEGVGLDPRRWINIFHWNKICSELVYDYLYEISQEMKWFDLEMKLNEWKPDNFHAGDTRVILNWMSYRKYATLIYGV